MQPTDIPNPVQELQDRRDALEKRMDPAVWSQVAVLISDEVDYYQQRLAEVLAAHLPGVAPAVLALHAHAIDGDPESGCCGLPPRSYAGPESDPVV